MRNNKSQSVRLEWLTSLNTAVVAQTADPGVKLSALTWSPHNPQPGGNSCKSRADDKRKLSNLVQVGAKYANDPALLAH